MRQAFVPDWAVLLNGEGQHHVAVDGADDGVGAGLGEGKLLLVAVLEGGAFAVELSRAVAARIAARLFADTDDVIATAGDGVVEGDGGASFDREGGLWAAADGEALSVHTDGVGGASAARAAGATRAAGLLAATDDDERED